MITHVEFVSYLFVFVFCFLTGEHEIRFRHSCQDVYSSCSKLVGYVESILAEGCVTADLVHRVLSHSPLLHSILQYLQDENYSCSPTFPEVVAIYF